MATIADYRRRLGEVFFFPGGPHVGLTGIYDEVGLEHFSYCLTDYPELIDALLECHTLSAISWVEHLPEGMYFEGAGDALFCGATLFAGYRIRSDVRGHQYLAQAVGTQVLPLELINPRFYHLDTCFCPLAPGEAIYYPAAFDGYGRKVLQGNIPKLLPVNEAEAHRFGCNAVVVGRTVIVNTGCECLEADLRSWGYRTVAVELDEFLKAGGSAKCLTLRLDGEEAAAWAREGALARSRSS